MIGKTLSHYKVIEKIGQGGMGVVYRAEDTNLSRDVAIKVLPEQFTKDPQRLARFEREAKLLASLNHPNIAAIYGFEEADNVRFLAMELVPGETLAERVAKGPVPVEEALEICRQIAEGVEAAHEKGVIHRDLKPANVKVTPEGKVKILDFGLAKAFEDEIPAADISQSPTLTEEMTRAGVILGTAAYMSPEQARGEEVDKRTDIFAFGCVLYELLTGRRTFEGKTVTDTLAKVLEGVPDWKALPNNTPWRIQELLQRCLSKDPDDRLFHVGEARIQIKKALKEPATASPTVVTGTVQPGGQRWGMTMGLVVLGAVVAGLVVWFLVQPSSPEQPLNQFVITPPPGAPLVDTAGTDLAISPDGRRIIYLSQDQRQLYLRSMDDPTVRPIRGASGAGPNFFFSPDGEFVAFITGSGDLTKISLAGGASMTISSTPALRGGSWHAESGIVFSGAGGGLYQVSATGGEPELLAIPDPGQGRFYVSPEILPDGKAVVFTVINDVNFQTAVLSLETGEKKIVIEGGRQARYVPTGHLLYEVANSGTLMAAPFDLTQLEITGDSAPILEGVRQTTGAAIDFAFSADGTLVYVPGGSSAPHQHSLVWVDRQGRETLVTEEKRPFAAPRLSPDGKQVALSIGDVTGRNLSIFDFEAGSLSRLTFENERNGSADWSPDGKWLIFTSGQVGGEDGMVKQPADRSRPQERLTSTLNRQMTLSWSPDGQVVAFTESNRPGSGGFDIGILSLEGEGEPDFIISSEAAECCPRFSPDGKWLAYISNELGRMNVYISPYPEPEVEWLISEEEEGGEQPVWSPDGTELFYRTGNKMMVVPIQTRDQTLNAGKPEVLFEGSYVSTHSNPPGFQYYDISPDGQRFLMLKEGTEQESAQINVVLNWFEELKRLVPTN